MRKYFYEEVKKDIRRKIEEGAFKDKKLPSEKELCRQYNVSQITIRRALAELVNENYLIRQQGKGTFIKEKKELPKSLAILALLPLSANTFFYDEFYGEVWKGMEEEANLSGFNLLFSTHSPYLEHKKISLENIASDRICGVIVINELDRRYLYTMRDKGIKVILLDYTMDDFPAVVSDNVGGGFEATRYLISQGHEKIACFVVPSFGNSYPLRAEGYKKALEAFKLKEYFIFTPGEEKISGEGIEEMEELGYKTCRNFLRKGRKDITAIFAVSDAVALGAMRALKEEKIKVPEDISIIGFDGIVDGIYADVPLTTMDVPKRKMGQIAVRTLIEMIKKKEYLPKEIVLTPQLVIRSSVTQRKT